ncbi:MAG: hypothetical protein ACKERG_00575 [Candidatus Hodgkinia cicadicola]
MAQAEGHGGRDESERWGDGGWRGWGSREWESGRVGEWGDRDRDREEGGGKKEEKYKKKRKDGKAVGAPLPSSLPLISRRLSPRGPPAFAPPPLCADPFFPLLLLLS